MMLRRALALVLAFALAGSPAFAAPSEPPADDAGTESFVRQIVPKLLGRKPRGVLEIRLLADIAGLEGRDAVVRMLMEQPEFKGHWTGVLIDQMKTQRDTDWSQSPECYGGPLPSAPLGKATNEAQPAPNLAAFVRDSAITDDYPKAFNMFELIRASLELDDVFPVYRAYLYTLGNTVQESQMLSAAEDRAIVGAHFDEVFLGRNLECMTCHNTKNAVTAYKGNHHPLHAGLDPVVFDHLGGDVPPVDTETVTGYAQCAGCHGVTGEGGSGPSILGKSALQIQGVLEDPGPVMAVIDFDVTPAEVAQIADALRDPGPFSEQNLPETSAKHFGFWRRDFFSVDAPQEGFGPWNIAKSCAVVRNGSATEGPIPAFFGGFETSYGTVHDLDNALVSGRATLPGATTIEGDTAFAYMVAAKITENVWTELMGTPLTIVNYYARNADQKDLHRYLTEQVFIANGWSLKSLIAEILSLRFFNRRAPLISQQPHFDELPPIFDAFAPETRVCSSDPSRAPVDDFVFRDGGESTRNDAYASASGGGAGGGRVATFGDFSSNEQCAFNGQGDIVHRYTPRTLLRAASQALAWPEPQTFAGESYPSFELQRSIGQYISNFDPGRSTVDFQSLLSWDDAYSRCDKSGKSVPGNQDWIDALIAGIDPFNTAHADDPLTLRDVVLALKDWLIQEPTLGGQTLPSSGGGLVIADDLVFGQAPPSPPSEAQLLGALLGAPLDSDATSANVDEDALRELCGVYLKSPQSMLAGITRNDALTPPRLRVCKSGPCSYQSMCQAYRPALLALGYSIQCQAGLAGETLGFGTAPPDGHPDPDGLGKVSVSGNASVRP